jgi:hypothetical protein
MWRTTMRRSERAMFDALVDAYPRQLTRDELAAAADLTTTKSGTFTTYLSHLGSNGLADVDGQGVRASDTLFDGGNS